MVPDFLNKTWGIFIFSKISFTLSKQVHVFLYPGRAIRHGNGRFCGIPVNGSGDRIYPLPPGTYKNLSKLAARYGYRIPASNSWYFPAGSYRKRRVSWGFSPEIHGILLQESSPWVVMFFVLIMKVWIFGPTFWNNKLLSK